MSNLNSSVITITGGNNISISRSSGSYLLDINVDIIEYINFAFQVMGIDLTYEDFKNMSTDDKKAFLRDIKINKII